MKVRDTNSPRCLYTTTEFVNFPDYKEGALEKKEAILFGSQFHLKSYYDDLKKQGKDSKYFGLVFNCEREDRNFTPYSYTRNMAFWAGAIDQNRSFLLVTNIAYYPNRDCRLSGTISEIIWLIDNGYSPQINPNNIYTTYFHPPETPRFTTELADHSLISPIVTLQRMKNIRDQVLQERKKQASKIPDFLSLLNATSQTNFTQSSKKRKIDDDGERDSKRLKR